jgi:hypothetical protein
MLLSFLALLFLGYFSSFIFGTYISAVYPVDEHIVKGEDFTFRVIINEDNLKKSIDKFEIFLGKDVRFFPDYRYATLVKMDMEDLKNAMTVNQIRGNMVTFRCRHPNFSFPKGQVYFGYSQRLANGTRWEKHLMRNRVTVKKRVFWQFAVPFPRDLTKSCLMLGVDNMLTGAVAKTFPGKD